VLSSQAVVQRNAGNKGRDEKEKLKSALFDGVGDMKKSDGSDDSEDEAKKEKRRKKKEKK